MRTLLVLFFVCSVLFCIWSTYWKVQDYSWVYDQGFLLLWSDFYIWCQVSSTSWLTLTATRTMVMSVVISSTELTILWRASYCWPDLPVLISIVSVQYHNNVFFTFLKPHGWERLFHVYLSPPVLFHSE